MFKSNILTGFPLKTNTSLVINVFIGWLTYLLAALLGNSLYGWGWRPFSFL